MSQKEVITLVQTYIKNLNKAGLPIRKAFIYGSHARNEMHQESDIDVLLISEIFDGCSDEVRSKPWSLSLRVDHRIEPYR